MIEVIDKKVQEEVNNEVKEEVVEEKEEEKVTEEVAEATTIVIPVTTEGLVSTVLVVGLVRCRAQPQIVIQILWDRLLNKILLTYPEELPAETCMT